MGAAEWLVPKCCEPDNECIFQFTRDKKGTLFCNALSDSYFDGPCPFRKTHKDGMPEVMKEREGKT